jgi:uncharacterized integral membrane protein
MTDQEISVPHFAPSFSEALEATWYASFRFLRKTGVLVAAVLVILMCVAIAHREDSGMLSFFSGVFIFVVSIFVLGFAIVLSISARRLSQEKSAAYCSGYRFSAAGVDIANDVASVHMSWTGLHDFRRSKRLFMFRLRERSLLIFIPVRRVEERDRAPLERLLSEKCSGIVA